MMEPQGLGANNVMFTFIFLGLAVCVSFLIAFVEFMNRKQLLKKTSQTVWASARSNPVDVESRPNQQMEVRDKSYKKRGAATGNSMAADNPTQRRV